MFALFVLVPCFGQYPDFNPQPNNFIVSPHIINPSSFKEEVTIDFLYKNKTGLFNDLRSIYAGLIVPSNKRNFGFKIFSQQETLMFSKTKAHLSYAVKIEFNKRFNWVLGSQAGISNIYFGSSNASSGGSDSNFDISFASTMSYEKLKWALILHQITNANLMPIDYIFSLRPYLESYVLYQFDLGSLLKLNTAYKILYQSNFYNDLNLELEHDGNMGALISLKNDYMSAGGFLNFSIESFTTRMHASYSFQPFWGTNRQIIMNEIEVGLMITIDP